MDSVEMCSASSSIPLAQHSKKKKQTEAAQAAAAAHDFQLCIPLAAPAPQPVESPAQASRRDLATAVQHGCNPICVFPDQIAATTLVLTYTCSTFSRRHPVILSTLDQPILTVRSNTFKFTQERELRNGTNDQVLMTVHRQIWTAGPPFYLFITPSGIELLRLERHWQSGMSRMFATFKNTFSGQQQYLVMDGDWASPNATVRNASTNSLLAEFRLNWHRWKQTYTVTIQPDVDVALIIGMVMCFDDREGHDLHVSSPSKMEPAWRKDCEHAAVKRREIQLAGRRASLGNLDGTIADIVREQRKVLGRSLHRREKRFKGPGQHLQRDGVGQHPQKVWNTLSNYALRDAAPGANTLGIVIDAEGLRRKNINTIDNKQHTYC